MGADVGPASPRISRCSIRATAGFRMRCNVHGPFAWTTGSSPVVTTLGRLQRSRIHIVIAGLDRQSMHSYRCGESMGQCVARIERSEIRDVPRCRAGTPDFAMLNPGYGGFRIRCNASRPVGSVVAAFKTLTSSLPGLTGDPCQPIDAANPWDNV